MQNPPDNLRIKIALDTQILAYLVDNTYPNLTFFIRTLSESPFVDIVCSRFAIYEFIGIRKLEHYLRCLVSETQNKGGQINFSSALKYKNEFDTPELKYVDVYENIKQAVEEELVKIYNDFGIIHESVNIHKDLWEPHQDLVLSTRISKEDSLLLLSSVFPDTLRKEDYLVLFTNDNQFYKALCGDGETEISDKVFQEHGLIKPHTYHLTKVQLYQTGQSCNIIGDSLNEEEIKEFVCKFILEHILNKNKELYVGRIVSCPASMEGKLMCFKLFADELNKDVYVTILSHKLDYLYHHRESLKDFYNITKISDYPYIPNNEVDTSRNISVEIKNKEGEYLSKEDYEKVSENGNLIFINPDTFII